MYTIIKVTISYKDKVFTNEASFPIFKYYKNNKPNSKARIRKELGLTARELNNLLSPPFFELIQNTIFDSVEISDPDVSVDHKQKLYKMRLKNLYPDKIHFNTHRLFRDRADKNPFTGLLQGLDGYIFNDEIKIKFTKKVLNNA